ncbi:hypothetical protein TRFO_24623 [Tritrichomonas foetus]|uniref:C2 domain-containing protein n=1 Tax=Tritrichomonas foetus TaxID=1144522 RepID=A0A1J4K7W3_9EUKA|nr:hypothetical protein TRFO_24623 [Tritrichomonas foetus]|eukprot:OHT07283.1 hypothetical protein TRFO_24623 [Tritrichomonas foetus]
MPHLYVRILQVSIDPIPLNPHSRLVVSATINPLGKRKAHLFASKNTQSIDHSFSFDFDEGNANFLSLSLRKKSFAFVDPMIGYDVIDLSNLQRNEVVREVRTLKRKDSDMKYGELHIMIHLCDDNSPSFNASCSCFC